MRVVLHESFSSLRFELHGRAMGIVAGFAELEVVVTTSLAEPVTRFELPSFSFAHELRLCAHTHRLGAHGRLTTLCADRLLCPVVVLAVAAHPVTTFELDGRAVFIVAGVTELEVAVTTCPAEPVARMDLPSSTCDLCRVSSGTPEHRLNALRPCLTQRLYAHCGCLWCQLWNECPLLWALCQPWNEWRHRPSITVTATAILLWTQYLLEINAQLTKWTDRNVIIDVAFCSFLAAPPALPNTPCEQWRGQRIPDRSPKGGLRWNASGDGRPEG